MAFALAAVLAGCHSSRHVATGGSSGSAIVEVEKPQTGEEQRNTNVQAVSAKLKLKLEAGDKSISCGGTYRMLHDDVVQISLTYPILFVSMDVGKLELTRDSILLINKMGKQYCRASYDDIPALKKAGVDFFYLQRVFWGDAEGETNSFVDFSYADWTQLGDGRFPQEIAMTLKGDKASGYKMVFELSKVQDNPDWEMRLEIPSGYEEVSLDTVMSAITKLVK